MNGKIVILCGCLVWLSACGHLSKSDEDARYPALLSDSVAIAGCVYLSADEKDRPVISWCETDKRSGVKNFYLSFFDESTGSFPDRIAVPLEQNANLHEEGMPKLAFKSDGTIIAVYETALPSDKNRFAGFVRYIVSADKGRSWSSPACLHADTSGEKSRSFAAVARLSDGEIGACWLDESPGRRVGGRPVKFAKTGRDNRFANEQVIDSVACQCCRIAITGATDGRIAVAFRDILNDSVRDMSVITSLDNGKTFTPAVPFSGDSWVINGCPHNGPSLAMAGDTIYAAWFTGGLRQGVYYCELNDKKDIISKQQVSDHGRFIQLCLLNDGSRVLAYNEYMQEAGNNYSKIVLNKISRGKVFTADVSTEKATANYPVVRSFGAGNIVVAWAANERVYYSIKNAADITMSVQRQAVRQSVAGSVPAPDLSKIKLAGSTDLVCGMPLSLSPADTALFNGRIYGFCSEICKEKFLQRPEVFIIK